MAAPFKIVNKELDRPTLKEFQHSPLRHKSSIRILELLPGRRGSPLRCKVIEKQLEFCGSYEALSYVWGEPELMKTIAQGKEVIRITRNCSIALHHLRKSKGSRFLWVDTICIDQKSPQERNHQVGMMGRVYSQARRVIVWLGTSQSRQSNAAMTYIRHISKQGLVPEKGHYDSKVPDLDVLFAKSWFSRTWPVQEVAFARECRIICGDFSISAEELMNFLTLVKDYTIVNDNLHRAHVHRQMWRYIRHVRFQNNRVQYNTPHTSVLSTQLRTRLTNCTAMLLRTQNLDATDPRDKIFAVHNLLSALGAHLPDPDYSKSIDQVYREAAATAITHDSRLHILSSVTGESSIEDLPSWVPDWSCSRPITEIASWDDYATPSVTGSAFRISADKRLLELQGWVIDKIEERSKPFPSRFHGSRVARNNEIKILQGWFRNFEANLLQDELVVLISGLSEKPWRRMKSRFNLPTYTLSKYWIQGLKSFRETLWAGYADQLRSQAGYCAKKDDIEHKPVREDIVHFHNLMRTLLDRKVMFKTERLYLGFASQALQIDDRIVCFQGASLPMIVRRVGWDWRLIAPAYIHDGMPEQVLGEDRMEHESESGTVQDKLLASLQPLQSDQMRDFILV